MAAHPPQCKARSARLEVRYAEVKLQAPQRKPKPGSVRVWVVTAVEVGAPVGEEPVEWKLIAILEVKSLAEALISHRAGTGQ